ncbi:SusE domain-containing protein [Algoriphagus boritolerans]|uniref:SusE outer membrane protein n=1 Tax=Algoriphagus boritolerans DSM 17298 = JCM 18970 TaxID=1120964 RepID=A0A1H5VJR8_9BACT|nr:SusE domain-containing protein [Algoriphagus boritolerans]SEF87276.1 SusE outer membrane protein [Algoriphagus boritolerans DSM 17298 = JCM 18970]
MKVIQRIAWAVVLIPMFWGCDTYEMPPIVPQTASSLSSPASGTSIVLQKDGAAESDLEFTVTAADFGTSGVVKYSLQMDVPGSNFSEPVNLGAETESNIIAVNVEELNDALLAKGLPFEVPSDVEFRVRATINQNLSPIVGEPTTLSITPYDATVAFPVMYVPGDYQGWNPENEMTVLYSENFDNKFKGFVHIIGGSREFKLTEGPNWDVNYGDDGANNTLDLNGENIKVAEDGTYELNVDLAAKTYTISTAKRWGIVGSATAGGWDSDTVLDTFDRETNSLKITTDLAAGEMKFRANNNWDFNYGGSNGELTAGGDNITIAEAGNYTITFYLGPAGLASYTLVKN